ncbi:MAG: peptide deformylase [Firmicutes bacterium]|nr:peptide deformylase [Clostridiales bacterium]MBQ4339964.1 peptide deformylase [Bacillota bacterium]
MAIRNVLKEGDETLRKQSREVTNINERIHTLLDDMAETMYASDGVGLAAPQVGVLRRVIVIDIRDSNGLIELINPVITSKNGYQYSEEGCLSVPGVVAKVERPFEVTVKGLNRAGEEVEYKAADFLAKAFCHEIDHLNGMLFIDHPHELVEYDDEEEEGEE